MISSLTALRRHFARVLGFGQSHPRIRWAMGEEHHPELMKKFIQPFGGTLKLKPSVMFMGSQCADRAVHAFDMRGRVS